MTQRNQAINLLAESYALYDAASQSQSPHLSALACKGRGCAADLVRSLAHDEENIEVDLPVSELVFNDPDEYEAMLYEAARSKAIKVSPRKDTGSLKNAFVVSRNLFRDKAAKPFMSFKVQLNWRREMVL